MEKREKERESRTHAHTHTHPHARTHAHTLTRWIGKGGEDARVSQTIHSNFPTVAVNKNLCPNGLQS